MDFPIKEPSLPVGSIITFAGNFSKEFETNI